MLKAFLQTQELITPYYNNREKQVINQVNKFLKAKSNFLTLREAAIKKLQDCYEMKQFQDILVKYNEDGLFQIDEDYNSLMNMIQENKKLEVGFKVNNILKLDSFDLKKYKIITIATNSWEVTRTHRTHSNMMKEDIDSLKKNLNEFKSELRQQKKELKNLLVD
jgi:hypothetical protein